MSDTTTTTQDGTGGTDALSTRIDASHAPKLEDIDHPRDVREVSAALASIAPKADAGERDAAAARILRDMDILAGFKSNTDAHNRKLQQQAQAARELGDNCSLGSPDAAELLRRKQEQADQARRTAGATAALTDLSQSNCLHTRTAYHAATRLGYLRGWAHACYAVDRMYDAVRTGIDPHSAYSAFLDEMIAAGRNAERLSQLRVWSDAKGGA